MKQILKSYKIIVLLTLFGFTVNAQDITVNAKMDTTEFLIGDQIGVELELKQPIKEFVGIPVLDQEEGAELEVLEQSENDTTLLESGHYLIKKRLLVTVFDSGYYAFPAVPFLYYSDTLRTEPIIFKVNGVAVDTSQAIKDIKMPYSAPISFAEVYPWAGSGLGLVALILVLIYIIRKIRRKEPILKRSKPREPAHIIALRDLEKLKNEKLWQKEKIKDYYTELTDILRMYLWNRYSIRTMERTSEEILDSLKISDFKDDDAFNTLKEIFYTSDLVKFAKFKPLIDEHEKCLKESFEFVDKTKLIIEEKKEDDLIESSEAETKQEVKELEEQNK
jgi:hypothetical protein